MTQIIVKRYSGSSGALCVKSVLTAIQRRGRKLSRQSCYPWPTQPSLNPLPLPFRHPAIPGGSATLCGFVFFLCLCAAGAARQITISERYVKHHVYERCSEITDQ